MTLIKKCYLLLLLVFLTIICCTILYFGFEPNLNVSFLPVILEPNSLHKLNGPNISRIVIAHKGIQLISVKNWGTKYRPIRVWCCIKTIYDKTQLLTIQETWGKYCDKLLFIMGNNEQKYIEEINIKYSDGTHLTNIIRLQLKYTSQNRTATAPAISTKDLWEKCWKTYEYLYTYYRNDFDWVITADNDAWFSAYNFKGYAQYFDPNESWYMGHTLIHGWRKQNYVFNAGGLFALSIGSIRKLNRIFKTSEFKNGKYNHRTCTAYGSWQDDTHVGICLKSIGIFPINTLDEYYRVRFSLWPYHAITRFTYGTTRWYWRDRFKNTPVKQNCCSIHAISFHYYKNATLRRKYFRQLDKMFTEKSKYNWTNHLLPPMPTTFLFNDSFNEFDQYFNVKHPPKAQKIWKGVDNLWNYTE